MTRICTLVTGAAIIASAAAGPAQTQILQQERDPWERERQVQQDQRPPGQWQEAPRQQDQWQQPAPGQWQEPGQPQGQWQDRQMQQGQQPQDQWREPSQQPPGQWRDEAQSQPEPQQWQEESDWHDEGQWQDEGERLEQGEQQEEGVIGDDGEEERIANPVAEFTGLDKITGRVTSFDVLVDETVQFGALQVTPRRCYSRPPTEQPLTTVFVEVDEVTLDEEIQRIFTGWMLADSPGLHAVEHPIYDVWLTNCKTSSDEVEVGSR